MQNQELTPVFTGQSQDFQGVTLTPEIITLDGETRLRVKGTDGSELFIPADLLPALAARAGFFSNSLARTLDDARRAEFHPTARHTLTETSGEKNKVLITPNSDPNADGTPYLTWYTQQGDRTHGWVLSLTGIESAALGFAAWDDITAQDNLVAMLADPESCLAIAAITAPEPTARMSARITARTLRSARALPGIDLPKARKIITDANLATADSISGYYAGRLRLLTIASGDKQVPVAVAIKAPERYEGMREISQDEARQMSWQDRSKLLSAYLEEKRTPWVANVKTAFTNAGWRILDLKTEGRHNQEVFFVTRIDAETWSSVAAAAQASARYLEMGRGGRV